MPIYDYRCEACGHVTSVLFRTSASMAEPKCESCGSAAMTRAVSLPGLIRSSGGTPSGSLQPANPREAIRQMSEMYNSSGDPGKGFNDVVRRVEAGDSPSELKEAIKEARQKESTSNPSTAKG